MWKSTVRLFPTSVRTCARSYSSAAEHRFVHKRAQHRNELVKPQLNLRFGYASLPAMGSSASKGVTGMGSGNDRQYTRAPEQRGAATLHEDAWDKRESPYEQRVGGTGRDAFFVCEKGFGVAESPMMTAAEPHARRLMHTAAQAIIQEGFIHAKDVLVETAKRALSHPHLSSHHTEQSAHAYSDARAVVPMSLAVLGPENVLRVTTVGSTGFVALRGGEVVYQTDGATQHDGALHDEDNSVFASNVAMNLREGDMLITGTEGLFKHLSAAEIARVTRMVLLYCDASTTNTVQMVADALLLTAHNTAANNTTSSSSHQLSNATAVVALAAKPPQSPNGVVEMYYRYA